MADGLAGSASERWFDDASTGHAFKAVNLERMATAVFVTTLGVFDLQRPKARQV